MGPLECNVKLTGRTSRIRNLMRSHWRCELIKLTKRNAKGFESLEFHSTNETEMNEFGMDRNLGNYDLFIISYSIMLEVGVKLEAFSCCCLKIILKKFV